MSRAPVVSVVVPTFQRRGSVLRLLAALSRQTMPPRTFEVVVSIDGSTDGTNEVVASFAAPFGLRSLWQPNAGRATACNAGLRESQGDLVVILDDDMEPAPECLAAHAAAHAARSNIGLLGAVPIAYGTGSPPVVRYVGRRFQAHLDRLAAAGRALTVRDFYSGNFSIARRVLHEAGGFDEAFRIYGHEDVELAARLTARGVELLYGREALAWQHYEKSFADLARDNVAKGRTAVLCEAKHPEVADQLRLATYRGASRRWFWSRRVMLAAARAVPALPRLVVAATSRLESWRPAWAERCYGWVLDYCFWTGARAGRRELDRVGLSGAARPSGAPSDRSFSSGRR